MIFTTKDPVPFAGFPTLVEGSSTDWAAMALASARPESRVQENSGTTDQPLPLHLTVLHRLIKCPFFFCHPVIVSSKPPKEKNGNRRQQWQALWRV
jgi:hypothetical protein